jgi:hypothetical protein
VREQRVLRIQHVDDVARADLVTRLGRIEGARDDTMLCLRRLDPRYVVIHGHVQRAGIGDGLPRQVDAVSRAALNCCAARRRSALIAPPVYRGTESSTPQTVALLVALRIE